MAGSLQRGRVGGVSPFFAFQDIITSAMAVLIVIIMLLALSMGPTATKASDSAPARAKAELDTLVRQLQAANDLLAAAEKGWGDHELGDAVLSGQIAELQAEAQAAEEQLRKLGEVRSKIERAHGDDAQRELELQTRAIGNASQRLKNLAEVAAGSLNRANSSETALTNLKGEELAARNVMYLIPDATHTDKKPLIAVITGNAVTFQRFDTAQKTEVTGPDLESKFIDALRSFSAHDYYVVLFFKPSGVGAFKSMTKATKNAGFEIGYDAVDEKVELKLGAPPPR